MEGHVKFTRAIQYTIDRGSNVGRTLYEALINSQQFEKVDALAKSMDYLSVDDKNVGFFSYMPADKVQKVIDEYGLLYSSSIRQSMKAGKFVRKFFTKEYIDITFSDGEIETFGNLIKTYTTPNEFKIEVVEGSDILQYYSEDSYFNENGDRGTLWDSCMRHDSCQDWFNIYTLNTGTVSLAVLKNDDNIIKGRAILWNFNGVSLMDRIYHYEDSNEQIFRDWAVENKYHYKEEQNYCNANFIDYEDGGVMDDGFDIPLNVDMDWEFPYMDTFKYLNEDGVSSSSCDENVGVLEDIGGGMKRKKRLCAIHGDYHRESDMTLITGGQYEGDYVYYEEARRCSSDGTQRVIDELTHVERTDCWYLHNDVVEVLNTDGKRIYYYVGDTVKNDAIGEILISRYTIEAVDGNRYYEKDLVYYTNIGHVYKHINQKPFVKLEKEIKSKLERAMSRKHDMLSRALELAKTKHQLQTTKTIALVS